MSAFWAWAKLYIVPWLKKAWKPLLFVAGIVVAILLGKRLFGSIVDSLLGRVVRSNNWTPITGNPTHITVTTPEGQSQVVKLPVDAKGKQVMVNQVRGVSYVPGYLAKVEVKNDAVNRR